MRLIALNISPGSGGAQKAIEYLNVVLECSAWFRMPTCANSMGVVVSIVPSERNGTNS